MRCRLICVCLIFIAFSGAASQAAPHVHRGGVVSLPFVINDGKSPNWVLLNGGFLQQRPIVPNDEPIYAQGAVLTINGNPPGANTNQAKYDEKTGELTFDNLQPVEGVQIERHVLIMRDENLVRYVDVFHNTGTNDASLAVQLSTVLNEGINAAQTMNDAKHPGADWAWIAQTQRGRSVVEMIGQRGGDKGGQVTWEQGSNTVQFNFQLNVPAGKTAALMHVHAIVPSQDRATDMVNSLKPAKLVSTLPSDVRRAIVNFPVNSNFVGDREILRGNMFDVVELRSGDLLNGTLQEKSYQLQTLFGPMEMPADKIVGLMNVGQYRPRQLLISNEGEMIGGTLTKQTIDLQLGSGQVTQIPLSQISRVGYRKRQDEPEEWKFDKPLVILQSGDRMNIALPDQPIQVLSRYGTLKLDPKSIASISMQSDEHGVHEIVLADGTHFAGLVAADQLSLKLSFNGAAITVPTSSIARLQFLPSTPDITDDTPNLSVLSGDVLVGSLSGDLKLDTAFDTIKVAASQIRALSRSKDSISDVQITLWDQTKLSGQLEDPILACTLNCGVAMNVPIALVDSYSQPAPTPSDQLMQKVKALVAQLNADDWKQRDDAQSQLAAMGSSVVNVLKKMRADLSPEAQQRIDTIVKQFDLDKVGAPIPAPAER
jgi:hypothetical protein